MTGTTPPRLDALSIHDGPSSSTVSYEVDPLTCTRCGGEMKILAFISEHDAIHKLLGHRDKTAAEPRAPPTNTPQ
jgi:hypothetical protein